MSSKSHLTQSVIYLSLPFLIFCVGFLHWYWALIMIVSLGWSSRAIFQSLEKVLDSWQISLKQVLLCASVSLFCCFILGIGGFWSQSSDWFVKNPLLNDLTLSDWPLLLDFSKATSEVKSLCGEGRAGFVYYLFFYLPAATIGKVFGSLLVARFVIFFWSAYGLCLVLVSLGGLTSKLNSETWRKTLFVLLLFVFWGGFDIIGQILRIIYLWSNDYYPIMPTSLIDCWCSPYFSYYASHFTSLFWCFNQCIPLWLITIIIYTFFDLRVVGFFYSFSLLYSPWGAIGLLPIILFGIVEKLKQTNGKEFVQMISLANIGFPLMVFVVVGTYYFSNNTSCWEKGFFWNFLSIGEFFGKYILFILIELGIYIWLVRDRITHDALLFGSILTLLLIPFYKMTGPNDFLMRASIPALFIVFICWVVWCIDHYQKYKRIILIITVLSSFNALQLIHNTTKYTILNRGPMTHKQDKLFSDCDDTFIAQCGEKQFYAHYYQETFFWKYLAKKAD